MAFRTEHIAGATKMQRPKHGAIFWYVSMTAFGALVISYNLFHFCEAKTDNDETNYRDDYQKRTD